MEVAPDFDKTNQKKLKNDIVTLITFCWRAGRLHLPDVGGRGQDGGGGRG
jgi:hypothetical protein